MDESPRKVDPDRLDKFDSMERKYFLDVESTDAEIELLSKVFAEVGRAILLRRQQANAPLQD